MSYDFAPLAAGLADLWSKMTLRPERRAEFTATGTRLYANRTRYAAVTAATGVPMCVIAVIHEREASADFSTYLGNGDPLNRVSVHFPAGRGPFATWEDGAVDALKLEGVDKVTHWTIERALFVLEGYNGFGYRNRGLRSPYLWGGTSQQQAGKYVADGHFDPNAMDGQLGCAGLLAALWAIDPTWRLPMEGEPAPSPPAASPATPAAVAPRFSVDDVKSIQTGLQALGFYRDVIDGDPGPHTRAALTAFAAAI